MEMPSAEFERLLELVETLNLRRSATMKMVERSLTLYSGEEPREDSTPSALVRVNKSGWIRVCHAGEIQAPTLIRIFSHFRNYEKVKVGAGQFELAIQARP